MGPAPPSELVLAEAGITFEEPEEEPELQLEPSDASRWEPEPPEPPEPSRTSSSIRRRKLVTMKHLEVEKDIIRGIQLQKTLRSLGSVWMKSAQELGTAQSLQRWQQSVKVTGFDIFFSHTWMTKGRWKVLSLLLQTNWHFLVLGWMLGVLASIPLHLADAVPSFIDDECESFEYRDECSVRLYAHYFGMIGIIMGLAVAPCVPRFRDKMCFLDIVSIHQADKELMERGVYAIGGFLSISANLQILWQRPYFRRLWCVFELAAFRTCNPSGLISLSPIFIEVVLAIGLAMQYLFQSVTALVLLSGLSGETSNTLVFRFVFVLPFIHFFRRSLHEKHEMIQDLRNFDVDNAECALDFDKEFIYAGIRAWYGSPDKFTSYVRGPLADELLEPIATLRVPRPYWLLLALPVSSWQICWVLAMIHAEAPSRAVLWNIMERLSFVLFSLLATKFIVVLSDYFAKPWRYDWIKTLAAWCAFCAVVVGAWQLYSSLAVQNAHSALVSSIALLILTILFVGDVRICTFKACKKAIRF